ncbi:MULTISPECIES: HAD family hydrolase [unclassified Halomonas]|uniref:HAD family hydrolase n=1 Tax=unclassified Halomonas TaxID=2609666 RepID=UPI0006D9D6BF|nr:MULTISPECIES: HAD-IA family hydrolase [unclassified Halomonas]KPQ21556.1 MAG: phosphoglycolate phosphatase, bacterial [Halomonas sp. HL-93]SBR48849.1 phosphoglycolate phosphatase [Halomonas sp. HL-93]SNY96079.1 phosphoglycolate phosphatase [Halomonas sp. hl-4]
MSTCSTPSAVLFDLDGTLVDTAPDLAVATNALRQHHGLAPLPFATIRAQVSNGGNALVSLALGNDLSVSHQREARQYLLDAYEKSVAVHSQVFSPLDQWLQVWQRRNRPWGIVTNKPRRYTTPLLEALSLTPGALLCADDLAAKKPDPMPLLEAAHRLGVKPQDCWYIGDHLRDMQAARAAGMTAVAVGYGYIAEGDDYRQWPAHCWYQQCASLVDALPSIA